MPNHVTNFLYINAPEERRKEVLAAIKGDAEEQYIDFNKIIKMPESLNIESGSRGEDGMRYIELMGKSYLTSGEETWINKFDARYKDEEREKVLEMGRTYLNNLANYGCKTWYEWSRRMWGTKWNAYDQEYDGEKISFNTAWNSPDPIFEELSRMFPDVEFGVVYADEDCGCNTGEGTYKDGYADMYYPDNCSDDAYRIYLRTHDWASGELQKVDGEWKWLDD